MNQHIEIPNDPFSNYQYSVFNVRTGSEYTMGLLQLGIRKAESIPRMSAELQLIVGLHKLVSSYCLGESVKRCGMAPRLRVNLSVDG